MIKHNIKPSKNLLVFTRVRLGEPQQDLRALRPARRRFARLFNAIPQLCDGQKSVAIHIKGLKGLSQVLEDSMEGEYDGNH